VHTELNFIIPTPKAQLLDQFQFLSSIWNPLSNEKMSTYTLSLIQYVLICTDTVRLRARNATFNRERREYPTRPVGDVDPELAVAPDSPIWGGGEPESTPSQRRQQSPATPGLEPSIPQPSHQSVASDDDQDFEAIPAMVEKKSKKGKKKKRSSTFTWDESALPESEAPDVYTSPLSETVEEPESFGMYKPPFVAIEVEDDRIHD
jgi:hypothetical protein